MSTHARTFWVFTVVKTRKLVNARKMLYEKFIGVWGRGGKFLEFVECVMPTFCINNVSRRDNVMFRKTPM
jgi:hypothetical protein